MGSNIRWDLIVLATVIVIGYPMLLWGFSATKSSEKSERALFEPRTGKLYSVHKGGWAVVAEISPPRSEVALASKIDTEGNIPESGGDKSEAAEEETTSDTSLDKPAIAEEENKPDFSYESTNTR